MRSKIYLKYDGVEYYGYDFYCEGMNEEDLVYLEEHVVPEIVSKCTTSGFVPQKGMKAYVVPGCPRAIADIRKDYVIKRKPEDADFIVGSMRKEKYLHYYRFDTIMIIPTKKAVVAYDRYGYGTRHPVNEYAEMIFPGYIAQDDMSSIIFSNNDVWFYAYHAANVGLSIDTALGTQIKPVVDYENLPIYTSNELCFDTLEMIYKIGTSERSQNGEENLVVQLQALNQTNWRDYPGTVHLLYNLMIAESHYNCASERFSRMSTFPKAIKEMCHVMSRSGQYKSNDDLAMGRRLLENITSLDLSENKFWDIQSIFHKLQEHNVNRVWFYELYENIVKVRPRCLN